MVYLSRDDEARDSAAPADTGATPLRPRKTVLIVEDEETVRELASEFARVAGHAVLAAKDAAEAVTIAEKSEAPIHLLVTDVVMPQMRGPELARKLKLLWEDLRIVYMSGYLEYDRDNGEFVEGGFFLQKPFSRDEFLCKVAEALKSDRSLGSRAL